MSNWEPQPDHRKQIGWREIMQDFFARFGGIDGPELQVLASHIKGAPAKVVGPTRNRLPRMPREITTVVIDDKHVDAILLARNFERDFEEQIDTAHDFLMRAPFGKASNKVNSYDIAPEN